MNRIFIDALCNRKRQAISAFVCLIVAVLIFPCRSVCHAQDTHGPDDPLASVNGSPIYLGELNLVLVDRLGISDLSKARQNVQQATAASLVRQHLAMISLRKLGGDSLSGMIDREIGAFTRETKRRGGSLEKHAKQRQSSVKALQNRLAFQIAWRQYLKSQLTDANLERFFESHRQKYAGGRWDVSQIFLSVDPKDSDTLTIATERMQGLLKEINASSMPADQFAAMAKQQSESPSGKDGGRIGWVEKAGDLPSSVMDAVRATKPGSISAAVRSPLGLHCVLVHDYQARDVKFSDLTDIAQLRRDATDALFQRLVSQQKDARIKWYISGLKPPANIDLIPPK